MQCLSSSRLQSESVHPQDDFLGASRSRTAGQPARSHTRASKCRLKLCRAKIGGEAFPQTPVNPAEAHRLAATPLFSKVLGACSQRSRAQHPAALWTLLQLQSLLSHTGTGLQRLMSTLSRCSFHRCCMQLQVLWALHKLLIFQMAGHEGLTASVHGVLDHHPSQCHFCIWGIVIVAHGLSHLGCCGIIAHEKAIDSAHLRMQEAQCQATPEQRTLGQDQG